MQAQNAGLLYVFVSIPFFNWGNQDVIPTQLPTEIMNQLTRSGRPLGQKGIWSPRDLSIYILPDFTDNSLLN